MFLARKSRTEKDFYARGLILNKPNFNKRKKVLLTVFASVIVIVSILFLISPYSSILLSVKGIDNLVKSFGVFSPIVFIGLMVIQIMFAPIPGHIIYLASGYLFGIVGGIVYGTVGLILGTFLAVYLSRYLGRPFVESLVSKENLKRFDEIAGEYGLLTIFVLFLLPGPPDDALCFIAGLTNIDIKYLILVIAAARVPGLVAMVLAGETLASSHLITFFIIIAIVGVLSILALKYRKEIVKKFK